MKLIQAHVENVHGTDHCPCPECNLVFKHPNSLKRHMSSHRDPLNGGTTAAAGPTAALEKGGGGGANANVKMPQESSTTCDVCGESFATNRILRMHINSQHRSVLPGKVPVSCSRGHEIKSRLMGRYLLGVFCPLSYSTSNIYLFK